MEDTLKLAENRELNPAIKSMRNERKSGRENTQPTGMRQEIQEGMALTGENPHASPWAPIEEKMIIDRMDRQRNHNRVLNSNR